jgi:hypothetical protein
MIPRVTFHVFNSARECEWMNPTLLSELPFWELDSQWTPKFLVGNCRGQNSLDWTVPYIIENLLDCKCLKWVLKTQVRAKRRVESQIANLTLKSPKVGNCPEFLVCKWHATYHWKVLNEGYNFALDLISIEDLHTKLWDSKVAGVSILGKFRDSHFGVPRQNGIWVLVPLPCTKYTIMGKVVASPNSGCGESCESVFVCCLSCTKSVQLCTNQLVVWFVQVCVSNWVACQSS